MKLAYTNHFVVLRNELGRDSRNYIRLNRLDTTATFKIRRPSETGRLECAWSLEPVACDGQLCRSRALKRGRARVRRVGSVRFGSKADICSEKGHVRFTPNSDRESGFPQTAMSALPPIADISGPRRDSALLQSLHAKGLEGPTIVSCIAQQVEGRG
jgi:hypothetical protein